MNLGVGRLQVTLWPPPTLADKHAFCLWPHPLSVNGFQVTDKRMPRLSACRPGLALYNAKRGHLVTGDFANSQKFVKLATVAADGPLSPPPQPSPQAGRERVGARGATASRRYNQSPNSSSKFRSFGRNKLRTPIVWNGPVRLARISPPHRKRCGLSRRIAPPGPHKPHPEGCGVPQFLHSEALDNLPQRRYNMPGAGRPAKNKGPRTCGVPHSAPQVGFPAWRQDPPEVFNW